MQMKLSTLAILLGVVFAGINLYAFLKPSNFAVAVKKFPRSVPIGYLLMFLATAWFVWNVRQESIADFESMKPFLYALFIGVGLGTCIFVKDFLAARGFAVMLLLVAKLMVDTARWSDTEWRLVIVIWAYLWVLAGIWFTISPWRLRDILNWSVADEKRLRILSGIRVAFGLFVAFLGIAVFKS